MRSDQPSTLAVVARFLFWLFLPLVVGALSGFVTSGSVETWYLTIEKPSFNPPGWVFGPVWTVLYLMIGVAAGLAFGRRRSSGTTNALVAFLVQLVLNGLWSIVFFGLHQPGWALVEIVVLWLAIGWTVRAFGRISKLAAWLLVPYWAWVSFATVLNASIWWLNR